MKKQAPPGPVTYHHVAAWEITDSTLSLTLLQAEASDLLQRMSEEGEFVFTGPTVWEVREDELVARMLGGGPDALVLVARTPACSVDEWYSRTGQVA